MIDVFKEVFARSWFNDVAVIQRLLAICFERLRVGFSLYVRHCLQIVSYSCGSLTFWSYKEKGLQRSL